MIQSNEGVANESAVDVSVSYVRRHDDNILLVGHHDKIVLKEPSMLQDDSIENLE